MFKTKQSKQIEHHYITYRLVGVHFLHFSKGINRITFIFGVIHNKYTFNLHFKNRQNWRHKKNTLWNKNRPHKINSKRKTGKIFINLIGKCQSCSCIIQTSSYTYVICPSDGTLNVAPCQG